MTEVLLIALGVAALIGVAIVVFITLGRRQAVRPPSPAEGVAADASETTLPVDDADPNDPATQRLVSDAAQRVLAADPKTTEVVVRSRGGRELGRVRRAEAGPAKPFVDLPPDLLEPHARRHVGPSDPIEPKTGAPSANVRFSEEPQHGEQAHRTLAEHFELSGSVREKITNPDDPLDIVRAILEASGTTFNVDDNVIVSGNRALVVIRAPLHGAVASEHLDAAYLRFERARVKHGVVVTPGTMYPHEVKRRQALAPSLLHAGPDGIQRMADAAAMGADPLDFVTPA